MSGKQQRTGKTATVAASCCNIIRTLQWPSHVAHGVARCVCVLTRAAIWWYIVANNRCITSSFGHDGLAGIICSITEEAVQAGRSGG